MKSIPKTEWAAALDAFVARLSASVGKKPSFAGEAAARRSAAGAAIHSAYDRMTYPPAYDLARGGVRPGWAV
jgi:hypothetical protein